MSTKCMSIKNMSEKVCVVLKGQSSILSIRKKITNKNETQRKLYKI